MAGTRLLMQTTFVVEFFLLAMTALYFGIYKTNDPLSHHLPIYQRGRKLIRRSLERLENIPTSIAIPALKIATTPSYLDVLKTNFENHSDISVEFIIREDTAPCAHDDEGLNDGDIDIWFCPPDKYEGSTQDGNGNNLGFSVVRRGITFLYCRRVEELERFIHELSLITPTTSSVSTLSPRRGLKISLMLEHRTDWKAWAQAVDAWIERASLEDWPCIRGPIRTKVILSTIKSPGTQASTTVRLLPTNEIQESIMDRMATSSGAWNGILFVPKTTPAMITDEAGTRANAMYVGHTLVSTISQAERKLVSRTIKTEENDTEIEKTVRDVIETPLDTLVSEALAPLCEFLLRQCLAVPSQVTTLNYLESGQVSMIAKWLLAAYVQQVLSETYHNVVSEVRQEGEWFLQSSTWVAIDEKNASYWEQFVLAVENARQLAADRRYLDALNILEDIRDRIQILRTDPTLMEPLQFSAPQFLAIFAPLLLPLFLPHLIGLVREWKRYKQLQNKTKKKAIEAAAGKEQL